MSDSTTTIDRYLDAFGEPDPDRRRALVGETFAENATLADPPIDATGHDGLTEMFGVVQQHYPGHTFRRTSGVDEHHGVARYEWELATDGGGSAITGTDIVRFGADGRIASVVGFFGPIPERLD